MSDKTKAGPRQIFVTKSAVLASKVEEHFLLYFASLAFASHMEGQARAANVRRKNPEQSEEDLFNPEDISTLRDDLPERFSKLEDGHFPLFITLDRVCSFLRYLYLKAEAVGILALYNDRGGY